MAEYQDIRYVTRKRRYRGVSFDVVVIIGDRGFVIDRVSVDGYRQMKDYEGSTFGTADEAFAEGERRAIGLIGE